MDYKEKYEKALAKTQKLIINENGMVRVDRTLLEDIFPELCESEDEKIRKALLEHIVRIDSEVPLGAYHRINGVDNSKIIAWLEKQCDKVSAIEGFETEFERQVSGLIASAINKEHEYNQDYVKWTANALLNYAKHELEKQGEQKPAWSEEDDEMLDSIIEEVRYIGYFPDYPTKEENELYDECLAKVEWLKSLKDRVHQKQEWNEEDEKYSSYICAALECYYRLREDRNNTNGQEDLDKARNWLHNKLKSLRPQNRWKPSDEQMKSLRWVIEYGNTTQTETLKGIYEQLKKLREE